MYKKIDLNEWQDIFKKGIEFTYNNQDNYIQSGYEINIKLCFDRVVYSISGARYCIFLHNENMLRINYVKAILVNLSNPHEIVIQTKSGVKYKFVHNNENFIKSCIKC